MKWRVLILALCWASMASAADQTPLDRNAALAKGGNLRVFTDYATRPYVVLSKEYFLRMALGGWRRQVHHVIAITNASGRSRGTMQYVFHESHKFQVSGATITPNNMRLDLGKNGVQIKKLGHYVQYTIVFPNVADGSILDLEYEIRGDWTLTYDEFRIAEPQPVLHAEVTIEDPDEMGAVVVARNVRDDQRVVKHTEDADGSKSGTIGFEFFAVPATRDESMAPPADVYWPLVTVYARNGRNWNWMALDEEPYFRAACDLKKSDEAKKLLDARIGKETDPAKKCAAVMRFVRNEVQLLGGEEWMGLYPQAATETLEGRAGSAMDVAGLAVGLMRRAGVEVRLGLVRRGTSGDWSGTVYKALQFDRFMPYVKLDDGWHWLDPVCKTCGFDDLDGTYCGTTAILFQTDVDKEIDSILKNAKNADSYEEWVKAIEFNIHNARWTEILEVCPAAEWLSDAEYDETLALDIGATGSLQGDLDITATGQRKLKLRAELLEMPATARVEWLAKSLKGRIPGVVVESVTVAGVEPDVQRGAAPDTVRIHARISVPNFVNGDHLVLPASFFAAPIHDPLQPGPRKNPIWVDRAGHDRTLVVLQLPAGLRCIQLPDPVAIHDAAIRYQANFAQVGEMVQFLRDFSWSRGGFDASDSKALHATYANIQKAEARRVEFVAGEGANARDR